jgi:hypothetical protein
MHFRARDLSVVKQNDMLRCVTAQRSGDAFLSSRPTLPASLMGWLVAKGEICPADYRMLFSHGSLSAGGATSILTTRARACRAGVRKFFI